MKEQKWRFIDSEGSFSIDAADCTAGLYFPLVNEAVMSSVSPTLHGDSKTGQHTFLLIPASRIDLAVSRASRNFWVYRDKKRIWSATGVSKLAEDTRKEECGIRAGLLWHTIHRKNQRIGTSAEILSFVPSGNDPVEIMQVVLTNITSTTIEITPTAAIPLFCRSAENIRDHRHVTSLLQRVQRDPFGVIVKPTLLFNESGHHPNTTSFFVLGCDEKGRPPEYVFPTQELFCGERGDLEAPESVIHNRTPPNAPIQGKEPMGALRFKRVSLSPGQRKTYIILMGVTQQGSAIRKIFRKFNTPKKVIDAHKETKKYWVGASQQIRVTTADPVFDNWYRWVSIQPILRKMYGCSFLPDFDYGKGGRGWRDLWQDCLGLILNSGDVEKLRAIFINNFSGVRIDGSNATIIGTQQGEFVSDRNNISRVWMDHGIWPLLTLDLYLHETGDYSILFEKAAYFRNHQLCRGRERDFEWTLADGQKLKSPDGKVYRGTVFEHLLAQNLVAFYHVGRHNHVRLEGADWNDGLDMAKENGESVAFSAMYSYTLNLLAKFLEKSRTKKVELAHELTILLRAGDYRSVTQKNKVLDEYLRDTKKTVSGKKVTLDAGTVAHNLRTKSAWMAAHIRKNEWLKEGFFNGYYDNLCRRVEGRRAGVVRMMLASQVFPIMSGVADTTQAQTAFRSIVRYLGDKKHKGFRLNTDFKEEQHHLGRAFSFVYGDKENGAFFNHMAVMCAYALYSRGLVKEGWQVFDSLYRMAKNIPNSKIYPCLPEYFNNEGTGMYMYLTGSASWYVLTLISQVYGVRGKDGDLCLEPKLTAAQFLHSTTLTIQRNFSGRKLTVNFINHHRLEWGKYSIVKVSLDGQAIPVVDRKYTLISRETILKLSSGKNHRIDIFLDSTRG
ncbi:MAG: cellobiose phosphorylase [Candidatus Omnitrophica bacterium]|nr:cellobiose phosphorylase [Candidatus Omnitrophota bacterium]